MTTNTEDEDAAIIRAYLDLWAANATAWAGEGDAGALVSQSLELAFAHLTGAGSKDDPQP